MKKICIGAGHYYHTAGKRTPDGIREWTMNNSVVEKFTYLLKDYDVEIIRIDDSTGETNVTLDERNEIVTNTNPDLYLSIHHNAYLGVWGNWTGFEVYYMQDDKELAKRLIPYLETEFLKEVYGRVVKQHGDEALRTADFDVLRDIPEAVPALLVEGGYMDSSNDSYYIRTTEGQFNYARGLAEFAIDELNLEKKGVEITEDEVSEWAKNARDWVMDEGISDGTRPKDCATREEVWTMLYRLEIGI